MCIAFHVRGPVLSFCSPGLYPPRVTALGGFFLGVVVCHVCSLVFLPKKGITNDDEKETVFRKRSQTLVFSKGFA